MRNVQEVPRPPDRPDDAHKGTFGTVIVVGGCATMIGAPALAGGAALRGGAGLVKIASRSEVIHPALTIEPEATGIVLPDDLGQLDVVLNRADPLKKAVLAVGPGLGCEAWAGELAAMLWRSLRPAVVDADALNLLAMQDQHQPADAHAIRVMTPHPGEFVRLAKPVGITLDPVDPRTRPEAATRLADIYQAVVVLKGAGTIVSDGDQLYVNTTGNPALATAGTGDVLTGLLASLLAQGMEPFDAAVLGVYLHGLAGDFWQNQYGSSGLTAGDLVRLLPQAFCQHRHK